LPCAIRGVERWCRGDVVAVQGRALMYAASIWYGWNSWMQWARDANPWFLSFSDKFVFIFFLLWITENLLKIKSWKTQFGVTDKDGNVMTVRRWILYDFYKESPLLEWVVIAFFLVFNMLNLWVNAWPFLFHLLRPLRSAEDPIDNLDQIIVVSRCIVVLFSMFHLIVQGYGYSARNYKLKNELVKPITNTMVKKLQSYQHVLMLIGTCLVVALFYWDYNNDFAVLDPFVNDIFVKTKKAIENILGPGPNQTEL